MTHPLLIKAKIMHKRNFPKKNFFCYNSTYINLPIFTQSNFNMEATKNKIFSINKFNIFSFYEKDHAQRTPNSNITQWALEIFEKIGINKNNISKITITTHPRCLGFVFNPVSFYFCYNLENQIIAIIAEVNNTFKQTHSYVIHEPNLTEISPNKTYQTHKEFFVSPFFEIHGQYSFRFIITKQKTQIFINYTKNNTTLLETSLIGTHHNLSEFNLIPTLFTTFKTVILINYQAIKLIIKKIKFKFPPKQPQNKLTFTHHDQH